ncbi:MAG: tripartite tricarboxylate transporter substrate-binding protein [Burkholderiales bacterium]
MKRQTAGAALLLATVIAAPVFAQTTTYPNRPIRFVVPFAPGGNADTISRNAGLKVAEAIGQQVVIDNRSGANGNIGMELVAQWCNRRARSARRLHHCARLHR